MWIVNQATERSKECLKGIYNTPRGVYILYNLFIVFIITAIFDAIFAIIIITKAELFIDHVSIAESDRTYIYIYDNIAVRIF